MSFDHGDPITEPQPRRRRRRRSSSESSHSGSDGGGSDPSDSVLEPTRPGWLLILLGLFPAVVCAFGSMEDARIQAGVAAVIGLLALFAPPKAKMPVALLGVAGVMVALPLLTIIELPWPQWPAWRLPLIQDFHFDLPSSWSAQPWVTLEELAGTVIALVWFLWCALALMGAGDRSRILQVLTAALILIAVVSLAFRFADIHPPLWNHTVQQTVDFGPFGNRNHLSTLMGMASLLCLACAYDLQRRKEKLWVFYGLGLVPTFSCILLNTSRAGVVLFVLGVVAWFATSSLRKGAGQRFAIAGSILLVATAALVLFGSRIMDKFRVVETGDLAVKVVGEGRAEIFRETFNLVSDQAGLGIGLGNFGAVYGMTNTLKDPLAISAHPESDWLWYLTEAGWPATLAVIIGLVFLISLTGPWKGDAESANRRSRRFRTTAAIAAGLSILHGVVDIPNHNRAHLIVLCMVGALALRPRKLVAAKGWSVPWLFRLGGLCCLAASACWVLSLQGRATYFGIADHTANFARAHAAYAAGDIPAALDAAENVVRACPLDSPAYTLRAQVSLAAGLPRNVALADFAKARYLEPNLAQVCIEERDTWMRYHPPLAMAALRELLRRDPIRAPVYYSVMLNDVLANHEELKPAMLDLATSPHFMLYYVVRARGAEFKTALDTFLRRYPSLEGLSAQEASDLFHVWQAHGDRDAMFQTLKAHPEWHPLAWSVLAEEHAARGDAESAYKVARRYIKPPLNLLPEQNATVEQLQRDFLFSPTDPMRGLTLAVTLRARNHPGDRELALQQLEKIINLPGARISALLEIATIHAEMGDYVQAWSLIKRYLSEPKTP